jgi:hypothetical protein
LPGIEHVNEWDEDFWTQRCELVVWLVKTHHECGLSNESLFSAVNILDRYCCRRVIINRHKYLLCSAILRIAAKYQDSHTALSTAILGSIPIQTIQSEGAYNVSDLNQVEWHILEVLDWRISSPDVYIFLQLALQGYTHDQLHLAAYIAEISLLHREFVCTRPSQLSMAVLAIVHHRAPPSIGCEELVLLLIAYTSIPHPVIKQKYIAMHSAVHMQAKLRARMYYTPALGNTLQSCTDFRGKGHQALQSTRKRRQSNEGPLMHRGQGMTCDGLIIRHQSVPSVMRHIKQRCCVLSNAGLSE